MELSQGAKELVLKYRAWYEGLEQKGATVTISVDEVAARVASFYEKIRGIVDWREEHLLRKTAIERILKRRFVLTGHPEEMAEPFLQELIRGGHFPNNLIPIAKIDETQQLINRYAALMKQSEEFDWLVSLAASEIEELLSPRQRERALIDYMAQEVSSQVQIRKRDEARITPEEKMFAIFVAVQRALFKLDDATISLHLLQRFYPTWAELPVKEVKKHVDAILSNPLSEKLYQIAERLDTPYLLLGDLLSQNPNTFEQLSQNPGEFESAIQKAYLVRLQKLNSRLNRAAVFSTLSVFLSKVLIALAIELPIDLNITQQFNALRLGASIVIPTLFLLVLVKSVRASTKENLQRILIEVAKITFINERKNMYEVSFPRKRSFAVNVLLEGVYLLMFFVSFGLLAWLLRKFQFSFLSTFVFLLFFSLVAFAGVRIRSRARELMVGKEREGFLKGILEFFGLPIVQVGKWLTGQITRYNVLVVLLNVLIEAPFQVFVEFLEQLRTFWQEKKEEIH